MLFRSENKTIRCHASLLATRSEKFKEMINKGTLYHTTHAHTPLVNSNLFLASTIEEDGRTKRLVEITDIPYPLFAPLVAVCYTDELKTRPQPPKQFLLLVKEFIPTSYKRVLAGLMQRAVVKT